MKKKNQNKFAVVWIVLLFNLPILFAHEIKYYCISPFNQLFNEIDIDIGLKLDLIQKQEIKSIKKYRIIKNQVDLHKIRVDSILLFQCEFDNCFNPVYLYKRINEEKILRLNFENIYDAGLIRQIKIIHEGDFTVSEFWPYYDKSKNILAIFEFEYDYNRIKQIKLLHGKLDGKFLPNFLSEKTRYYYDNNKIYKIVSNHSKYYVTHFDQKQQIESLEIGTKYFSLFGLKIYDNLELSTKYYRNKEYCETCYIVKKLWLDRLLYLGKFDKDTLSKGEQIISIISEVGLYSSDKLAEICNLDSIPFSKMINEQQYNIIKLNNRQLPIEINNKLKLDQFNNGNINKYYYTIILYDYY